MSKSKQHSFFHERHLQAHWELTAGKAIVTITFGEHQTHSFPYGTERTPLEQAAQWVLEKNEPVPEADIVVIDEDDRFWEETSPTQGVRHG